MSLNQRGELTIEQIVIMIILLLLLVVLLIYSGLLREQTASLFEKILGFFTGR